MKSRRDPKPYIEALNRLGVAVGHPIGRSRQGGLRPQDFQTWMALRGFSVWTTYRWLKGEQAPQGDNLEKLKRLCVQFGVPVDELQESG